MSEARDKKIGPRIETCVRCGASETWTLEELNRDEVFKVNNCEIRVGPFPSVEAVLCEECEDDLDALVKAFLAEKLKRPRKNILV